MGGPTPEMESPSAPQCLIGRLSFFFAVLHHPTWNPVDGESGECCGKLSVDVLVYWLEVALNLLAEAILAHGDCKIRGSLEYGKMFNLIHRAISGLT